MASLTALLDRLYIVLLKQLRPIDPQGAPLRQRNRKLRHDVLSYYQDHPTTDATICEALDYLRRRPDAVNVPAPFRDNYRYRNVVIDFDADRTPYMTLADGKRLFFLPDAPDRVRMALNNLLIEQDAASPHRYLTPSFTIEEGDIVADVGSAEGFLALQYVDKAKHVYIFESDEAWVSVLQKTFAPWADKVTIVRKFVSDKNDDRCLRLDSYFLKEGVVPTFVKLDVEGEELRVLNGLSALLQKGNPMKIVACTYHYHDEYADIVRFAEAANIRYETSSGWMLFNLYDQQQPPYFRHGLVRMWANERNV